MIEVMHQRKTKVGKLETLTISLGLMVSAIFLQSCDTPQQSNAASAIFRANSLLATDPRQALLWGVLGNAAETDAVMQNQVIAAESGRSQVNVYAQTANVPPQSDATNSPTSKPQTRNDTLFSSVLHSSDEALPSSVRSNQSLQRHALTPIWTFRALDDPEAVRNDSSGRLVDADGFALQSPLSETKDSRAERITYEALTASSRLQLLTIEKLVQGVIREPNPDAKQKLTENLLLAARTFNLGNLTYAHGWLLQADVALALDREIEGRMAARRLMGLRVEESTNPKTLEIMSALEQRGWLPK